MDLASFEIAEAPQRLEITHPETGKKTDIVIFVISPDHPDYKAKTLEMAREAVKSGEKPDIKMIIDRKNEIIARLITGWDGIQMNGKAFKFTPGNTLKLVTDFPWIADQIDSFCAKRSNFFKGSKKD